MFQALLTFGVLFFGMSAIIGALLGVAERTGWIRATGQYGLVGRPSTVLVVVSAEVGLTALSFLILSDSLGFEWGTILRDPVTTLGFLLLSLAGMAVLVSTYRMMTDRVTKIDRRTSAFYVLVGVGALAFGGVASAAPGALAPVFVFLLGYATFGMRSAVLRRVNDTSTLPEALEGRLRDVCERRGVTLAATYVVDMGGDERAVRIVGLYPFGSTMFVTDDAVEALSAEDLETLAIHAALSRRDGVQYVMALSVLLPLALLVATSLYVPVSSLLVAPLVIGHYLFGHPRLARRLVRRSDDRLVEKLGRDRVVTALRNAAVDGDSPGVLDPISISERVSRLR